MRRAVQTAYLLFKDSPGFDDIRVVLDPDLREGLDDSCTIPDGNVQELIKEYKKMFSTKNTIESTVLDTTPLDQLIEVEKKAGGTEESWFISNSEQENQNEFRKAML